MPRPARLERTISVIDRPESDSGSQFPSPNAISIAPLLRARARAVELLHYLKQDGLTQPIEDIDAGHRDNLSLSEIPDVFDLTAHHSTPTRVRFPVSTWV